MLLLFFLLYLACRRVPVREKAVYCGLLLIFYLSFSVNVLNFLWHGFHYPNSLPCRQSFLYIAVVLSMCYEGIREPKDCKPTWLTGAFAGAAIFILLAQKLIDLIRPEAKIVCEEQRLRPAASEVERLLGSNQLLYELTGFRPQTSIDTGLKITTDWIRSHMDTYKTDRYMV